MFFSISPDNHCRGFFVLSILLSLCHVNRKPETTIYLQTIGWYNYTGNSCFNILYYQPF